METEPKLEPNEMQINGKIYTISEQMIRKHPGGTVIKSKLGANATQAFNEFHMRTPRAYKWLETLPSRPGYKQPALLEDFDKLREDLKKEGFFDVSPLHIAYRIAEIAAMIVFGYWLIRMGWYWTGVFIMGVASGRCGWVQHEANHNSFTTATWLDRIIGSFYFSVGEAGSAAWWRSSHNRHHASPQHVTYDPDLNTLPAMAFDSITARMGNPSWLKFQAWTFQPSVWFVVLYWKLYLHPLAIWRKKAVWDGLFLVLHYIMWYYAFSFMPVWQMIGTHLVWGSVAGSYLFTHFALSHTHRDILLPDQKEDWVRSSILRTTNIPDHPIVNWLMGFLNFQIEHHLFPNMPQFRMPEVSKRVKELCKKHGLHYDEMGYFQCFYRTFKNLDCVGHHPDVGKDRRLKVRLSKNE